MNQQPLHKHLQVIIQWAETLGSTKSLLEPESQPLNPLMNFMKSCGSVFGSLIN